MIVSASRRSDLPAFYSKWLFERLAAGFALACNPMNPNQVRRVDLLPEAVDALVIWTKNPLPIMDGLERLKPYTCCFQFTITGYGADIEPRVPDKSALLIPAFIALAKEFGRGSVVWRYDPVFIGGKYTREYHAKRFMEIAGSLAGYAGRCVISFMDIYRCNAAFARQMGIGELSPDDMADIASGFVKTAAGFGMEVFACCESGLEAAGVKGAGCIDIQLLSGLAGREIAAPRDKNQRKGCGCAASVDIGAYDTCTAGCGYCYATHSAARAAAYAVSHAIYSERLI